MISPSGSFDYGGCRVFSDEMYFFADVDGFGVGTVIDIYGVKLVCSSYRVFDGRVVAGSGSANIQHTSRKG